MAGFEHFCQRSEDREAEARNLAWFSHLSGENRARMGWPRHVRIRAYLLSGEDTVAMQLADDYAMRIRALHPDRATVEIPHQRKPHPAEVLLLDQARRADRRAGRNPHSQSEIPYSGA